MTLRCSLISIIITILSIDVYYADGQINPLEAQAMGNFNYQNQRAWANISTVCGNGKRQTPINLNPSGTSMTTISLDENYYKKVTVIVTNDGSKVQCNYQPPEDKPGLVVTTGPYGLFGPTGGKFGQYGQPEQITKFLLTQFHFHWGPHDGVGGEHRIRGKIFSMEMHLVHYNSIYNSLLDANGKPNGVANLGVLFLVQPQDNPDFEPVFNSLAFIKPYGAFVPADLPSTASLLPARAGVITYLGSLCQPPCTEGVAWYIFDTPLRIGRNQLARIRNAIEGKDGKIVHLNYRSLQAINGRVVQTLRKPLINVPPMSIPTSSVGKKLKIQLFPKFPAKEYSNASVSPSLISNID